MFNKNLAARALRILGNIVFIFALYQIIRFFLGDIQAPLLNTIMEAISKPLPSQPKLLDELLFALLTPIKFLIGISIWMILGLILFDGSRNAARIVEVGYSAFMKEKQLAHDELSRLNKEEARKARRRELKRKLREGDGSKSSTSLTTLLAGILLGSFFF